MPLQTQWLYISTGDEENLAPQQTQAVNIIEVSEGPSMHTLVKKGPVDDSITISEKILIESASEKDRISEIKVHAMVIQTFSLTTSLNESCHLLPLLLSVFVSIYLMYSWLCQLTVSIHDCVN